MCERVAEEACAVRRAPTAANHTHSCCCCRRRRRRHSCRCRQVYYTSDSQMIWLPERQRQIHPKPDTVLRDTIRLTFLKPIQPEDFFLGKIYIIISIPTLYVSFRPPPRPDNPLRRVITRRPLEASTADPDTGRRSGIRLSIIIPTRRPRRRSFDGHSKGWLREKRRRRR